MLSDSRVSTHPAQHTHTWWALRGKPCLDLLSKDQESQTFPAAQQPLFKCQYQALSSTSCWSTSVSRHSIRSPSLHTQHLDLLLWWFLHSWRTQVTAKRLMHNSMVLSASLLIFSKLSTQPTHFSQFSWKK